MPDLLVETEGTFLRVADQGWADPLDTSFSASNGGRWNPPGSFGVLYLNADVNTARANFLAKYAGRPYGPEDLSQPPNLVSVRIKPEQYVDAQSDAGLSGLGLPTSYPRRTPRGRTIISHEVCQPIGGALFEAGRLGVACRSAATLNGNGRELAWFAQPRRRKPELLATQAFDDWY